MGDWLVVAGGLIVVAGGFWLIAGRPPAPRVDGPPDIGIGAGDGGLGDGGGHH